MVAGHDLSVIDPKAAGNAPPRAAIAPLVRAATLTVWHCRDTGLALYVSVS
jgi:hypothetical protein